MWWQMLGAQGRVDSSLASGIHVEHNMGLDHVFEVEKAAAMQRHKLSNLAQVAP